MQISNKVLSQTVSEILQQNDFFVGMKKYQHVDESFEFVKKSNGFSYRLGGRFLYHTDGYELNNFFQIIQVNELEDFVAPILINSGLNNDCNDTFMLNTKMREELKIFKKIWKLRITDDSFSEFKELLTDCVNNSIVPFFVEYSDTKRITENIKDLDFADLINSALRGKYPSNYFKAIYLFNKYGFEHKREDYLLNLAEWFEEDKTDPNHKHMYENYKKGYYNLIEKLRQ